MIALGANRINHTLTDPNLVGHDSESAAIAQR